MDKGCQTDWSMPIHLYVSVYPYNQTISTQAHQHTPDSTTPFPTLFNGNVKSPHFEQSEPIDLSKSSLSRDVTKPVAALLSPPMKNPPCAHSNKQYVPVVNPACPYSFSMFPHNRSYQTPQCPQLTNVVPNRWEYRLLPPSHTTCHVASQSPNQTSMQSISHRPLQLSNHSASQQHSELTSDISPQLPNVMPNRPTRHISSPSGNPQTFEFRSHISCQLTNGVYSTPRYELSNSSGITSASIEPNLWTGHGIMSPNAQTCDSVNNRATDLSTSPTVAYLPAQLENDETGSSHSVVISPQSNHSHTVQTESTVNVSLTVDDATDLVDNTVVGFQQPDSSNFLSIESPASGAANLKMGSIDDDARLIRSGSISTTYQEMGSPEIYASSSSTSEVEVMSLKSSTPVSFSMHSEADRGLTAALSEVPSPSLIQPGGELCRICGDAAAGFHCGAFVCEACKKFYIRAQKQESRVASCTGIEGTMCVLTKANRTSCSHCRYKKCLDAGMHPPGSGILDKANMAHLRCKVCGSPAEGFHFGALTCVGCKGFFRRCVRDASKKRSSLCSKNGRCGSTNLSSRQFCKACRFQKCIQAGMSLEASRIGRHPNSIRYARMMQFHADNSNSSCLSTSQDKEDVSIPVPLCTAQEQEEIKARYVTLEQHYAGYQLLLAVQEEKSLKYNSIEKIALGLHNAISHCVGLFLTFTNDLKDFMVLDLECRSKLMREAIYPVILLLSSESFNPSTNLCTVFSFQSTCSSGFTDSLAHYFPEYKVLLAHFKEFGSRICALDLDLTERALFAVVLLIQNDNINIANEEKKVLEELQSRYMDTLSDYITKVYGDQVNKLGNLLLLLAELRRAAYQYTVASQLVKCNYPQFNNSETNRHRLLIDDVFNDILRSKSANTTTL